MSHAPFTSDKKLEALRLLTQLSEKYPQLRLCQILGNAFPATADLYYVSDGDVVMALKELSARLEDQS